ncbi:hypothetical protein IGI04_028127, partial [Brassica rapa subsp. trilocularis]
ALRRSSFAVLSSIALSEALVPPLSLTVVRFVEQQRVRLEVSGGEGAACMLRGGGFPGGGGLHRSTVAGSSFREGSLLQTRLRWILVTESGSLQSSTLPLRNPAEDISSFDGTLRREDSAVKNGYGFVGGLSVSKLRRTRISLVVLR